MQPGGQASYIFPFITGNTSVQDSVYNVDDFQYLLYRPLYWFGEGTNPYLNPGLSLAKPPKYVGHQVRIQLKSNYKWSNGESVDARDVVFWMNMMLAEQNTANSWIATTQYGLPGDISNVREKSKYVVTMTITNPGFSPAWFTDNELSQITPMPMAWDRTAAGPSHCATTISDCAAVYDYLNQQAQSVKGYGSSLLWGVVDGPWRVKSLDPLGNLKLTFNSKYSGPVASNHITTLIELPFTTEQGEYNVLQAPGRQTIDVGYLPTVDAQPVPPGGAVVGPNPVPGYKLTAVYPWELSYIPYDYANSAAGPIFKQQYFRAAFQQLVDQEGVINGPLHGYGKPNFGPVSGYPDTTYLSPGLEQQGDKWTLNIPAAQQALKARGWVTHGPGNPDTCGDPGSGPKQCGPGVRAGTKLIFNLIYAAGIDYMQSAVRELASNALLAGIVIKLQAMSFNDVTGIAFTPSNHTWQLADWGGWSYSPDYLPTGDTLFQNGSANNAGGYNDATNNRYITDNLDAKPSQFYTTMYTWEDYLAKQLPVSWQPNTPTLLETIKGLDIGPQSSASTITPEMWSYRQ